MMARTHDRSSTEPGTLRRAGVPRLGLHSGRARPRRRLRSRRRGFGIRAYRGLHRRRARRRCIQQEVKRLTAKGEVLMSVVTELDRLTPTFEGKPVPQLAPKPGPQYQEHDISPTEL